MALISCKNCGQQLCDTAYVCPSCGTKSECFMHKRASSVYKISKVFAMITRICAIIFVAILGFVILASLGLVALGVNTRNPEIFAYIEVVECIGLIIATGIFIKPKANPKGYLVGSIFVAVSYALSLLSFSSDIESFVEKHSTIPYGKETTVEIIMYLLLITPFVFAAVKSVFLIILGVKSTKNFSKEKSSKVCFIIFYAFIVIEIFIKNYINGFGSIDYGVLIYIAVSAIVYLPTFLYIFFYPKGYVILPKVEQQQQYYQQNMAKQPSETQFSMAPATMVIPSRMEVQSTSTADELSKLKSLCDTGVISTDEYERLKNKAIEKHLGDEAK
ncbi:MAG: SHOCT domain-containing protein [Clostridiaceae bacterium]|nr:SHOCT domain-containing protein [Clostridiaceae bacterium]